ncbi:MAG: hypothetical protein WC686_05465 [Candidatus Shapirobacteria bacterium]
MRKIGLILLLISAVTLSGCNLSSTADNQAEKLQSAIIVKEGVIKTKVGEEYLLSTDGEIVNITSKKVDLEQYLNKKIRVEGMYSGSILYVDKVTE